MDAETTKFFESLIESKVIRNTLRGLRKYVTLINDGLEFISETCGAPRAGVDADGDSNDCINPQLLMVGFVWYQYVVYTFQLYMIPFSLMVYVLFQLITADDFNRVSSNIPTSTPPLAPTLQAEAPPALPAPPGSNNVSKACTNTTRRQVSNRNGTTKPKSATPPTMHPLLKLHALMELGKMVKSMMPAIKNIQTQLIKFWEWMDLSFVSWKCCKLLAGLTCWLYFVGLRSLFSAIGWIVLLRLHPVTKIVLRIGFIKLDLLHYLPLDQKQKKMMFTWVNNFCGSTIDENSHLKTLAGIGGSAVNNLPLPQTFTGSLASLNGEDVANIAFPSLLTPPLSSQTMVLESKDDDEDETTSMLRNSTEDTFPMPCTTPAVVSPPPELSISST